MLEVGFGMLGVAFKMLEVGFGMLGVAFKTNENCLGQEFSGVDDKHVGAVALLVDAVDSHPLPAYPVTYLAMGGVTVRLDGYGLKRGQWIFYGGQVFLSSLDIAFYVGD